MGCCSFGVALHNPNSSDTFLEIKGTKPKSNLEENGEAEAIPDPKIAGSNEKSIINADPLNT